MEVKNQEKAPETIDLSNYKWLIRPCDTYDDEYSECTSIKGRFHQYFIHGEMIDCSQWKKDYNACNRMGKDPKATDELVASEKLRYFKRMQAHVKNDVWENRKAPPEDWSKPLPEWMQKEHEGSYLAIRSEEMKTNVKKSVFDERTLCVIM